ncbi:MAG: glutathione peroxidase [Gammaproteobacteria bacterium]|nr:glutathione peroxidase [Gammaproteobacteria bacterium]NIR83623.1 glutathione peroxidase [Gammaproteobacteria bacterium]NIR91596.1 glutathione peroxidase [Gammaproteobacteria bacterium]NIU04785.1 glutathione peroxidase [Gammaproteobacteria bacterium]NIV53135.1 redoxin domain-containing protein [Gammaproteobacteria bacterium]
MSVHDFRFTSIDGDELSLSQFRDRAVLLVNTASECGYTPQYAGLQELWERYRDRGLVVLAVPCNDFGQQEPGREHAIRTFCAERYGVTFPMTTRVSIVEGDRHPFFQWLEAEFGEAAVPRWNFHKYLVGPEGELLGAWPSQVEPLSEEIVCAIEGTLRA